MSGQGVQGGIDGALGRADDAYGFLSPPRGSELAGSWTVFGADGGLRLSEVVRDLMPAAARWSATATRRVTSSWLTCSYSVRPSMPRSLTSSPEGSWSGGVSSSTRDSPPVSPSMVPEALTNSERVRLEKAPAPVGEGAGWLKMSQVNRSDGVLGPHRDLSINQTPDANFGGWDVTAPPLGVARARRP